MHRIGSFLVPALVAALGLAGCQSCPGIVSEDLATRGHVTVVDGKGAGTFAELSSTGAVSVDVFASGGQLALTFNPGAAAVSLTLEGMGKTGVLDLASLGATACVCVGDAVSHCSSPIDSSDKMDICEPALGTVTVEAWNETCDDKGCTGDFIADLFLAPLPGKHLSGVIHVEHHVTFDEHRLCISPSATNL